MLADTWSPADDQGCYDLWVYGPNGFVREFRGDLIGRNKFAELRLEYDPANAAIRLIATTFGPEAVLTVRANTYRSAGPWRLHARQGRPAIRDWSVAATYNWYDLTVVGEHFERRFAGRMETGAPSISDPAV